MHQRGLGSWRHTRPFANHPRQSLCPAAAICFKIPAIKPFSLTRRVKTTCYDATLKKGKKKKKDIKKIEKERKKNWQRVSSGFSLSSPPPPLHVPPTAIIISNSLSFKSFFPRSSVIARYPPTLSASLWEAGKKRVSSLQPKIRSEFSRYPKTTRVNWLVSACFSLFQLVLASRDSS